MIGAESIITLDLSGVVVALVTGIFALAGTFVTAGVFTRRNVRSAVRDTVEGHNDVEMERLKSIETAQDALVDELKMMRATMNASNELHATLAATFDRRFSLLEQRVERLERV